MKNEKNDLKLSLVYYMDACINAGQNGILSSGIADEIRSTQEDETVFYTMYDLISHIDFADFEQLKQFTDLCSKKIATSLDDFTNKETDCIKASVLSRIDFLNENEKLQKIK